MRDLFRTLLPMVSLFAVTGCVKQMKTSDREGAPDSTLTNLPPPLIVDLIRVVILQLEDKNMKAPIEDTTLLWDNVGHIPVMAPAVTRLLSVNSSGSRGGVKLYTLTTGNQYRYKSPGPGP